jgi:hypothetical protein
MLNIYKRLSWQESIKRHKLYEPYNSIPKYMKQNVTELKGETGSFTIMVGDINT